MLSGWRFKEILLLSTEDKKMLSSDLRKSVVIQREQMGAADSMTSKSWPRDPIKSVTV